MPLDAGDVEVSGLAQVADELAVLRPARVRLDEQEHLGAALAAARRSLDLGIEDIASATRVRSGYIAAIEASDFEALPARPFVIGYVRAYAMALGLDADAVVARFRAEAPPVSDVLQAPIGLESRASLAPRVLGVVAAMIVTSIVAWNLWRHAEARPLRSMAPVAEAPPAPLGPVALGAPPPTPPEASTPPAYQTPGLPPPGSSAEAPPAASAKAPIATPASGATGAPFVAAGAVYGSPAPGGGVILQARAPTPLIVKGANGTVYFARQLAAGEAWRAPAVAGLTIDVGSPTSVEVFVNGQSHGMLSQPQQPLSKLAAG